MASPQSKRDTDEDMEVQEEVGDLTVTGKPETETTDVQPTGPEEVNGGIVDGNMVSQDTDMEDDESRSEATYSFTVPNISKLKESVLSQAWYVRNLPWKIMVMPRTSPAGQHDRGPQKSLGFFLQCNGDSESSSWSCNAMAELRLLSQKEGMEHFTRKIQHLFFSKENDWGFSHFISWNDMLDPEKGYVKDDSIILQVHVTAEAPHGVSWDSKKHTGYVGLKNQGATCYMNSLLQTLYFTNELRKAVYKMPTESDDSQRSVALALQRVFYELQFSDRPVGTKKLTKSFGWETLDSFMQHDVQEFLRVLLDKLESKMKSTCVEGTVPKLFEGKTISFIKCKNVDYTSSRTETYYDIQLNIKGKKNIYESFKDYVATETLEGDNKYDAGENGLQDAEKGVIFASFPPILHLHLMRFQYDPITDNSVKFNDRFEFPEKLDLSQFLQKPEATPATYTLHAVLVHSGDNHGGHYVVFINPRGDGKWCKFDDDVVSRCSKSEAIDNNFGGPDDDTNLNIKQCTNAYMLVYIRDAALNHVLQEVIEGDIPAELVERLQEERKLETLRRKERNEAHLYMAVHCLLEDHFVGHQGFDLYDPETAMPRAFRIRKQATLTELMETLSEAFKYPVEQLRIWPLAGRTNHTLRPRAIEWEADALRPVIELAEGGSPWIVFLEVLEPDSGLIVLPPFDGDTHVLLFFKYYDPKEQKMHYAGHAIVPLSIQARALVPILCRKVGLPPDTRLALFEEVKPLMIDPMDNLDKPLENALEELMDGDIVCFQKYDEELMEQPLGTVKRYFWDYFHRIEVIFCDKAQPNDPGFTVGLSEDLSYEQVAKLVGERIGVEPNMLQFFKCQGYREGPGTAIRHNWSLSLKDMVPSVKGKGPKRVYYQRLAMPITELETKRQFRCNWVDAAYKEEKELVLYPNKLAKVEELFQEAKKAVTLSENGSGKLRLLEIVGFKIQNWVSDDTRLDVLNMTTPRWYRLEEIPKEELNLASDELLIPVAHFQKEPYSGFGIPFLLKVKEAEPFVSIRERIQKRLDVSEKEMDKYKFAVVVGNRARYLPDESDFTLNLDEFRPPITQPCQVQIRPWLGIDHLNKAPKRSRYSYLEKAIKIYN